MDDAEAHATYARKAARTLLSGSVVFGVLAFALLVAAVEDSRPTRALAALASLSFAFLSVMLFVLARRARTSSRRHEATD